LRDAPVPVRDNADNMVEKPHVAEADLFRRLHKRDEFLEVSAEVRKPVNIGA
jgi:hypothetical protein